MARSDIKQESLADIELLNEVVAFKQQFYPSAWSRYDLATIGNLLLMPSDKRKAEIVGDYDKMQEMIFAKTLTIDEIFDTLAGLEKEINLLGQ